VGCAVPRFDPSRDYKELRDQQRLERKQFLERRLEGGAPVTAGRSEAELSLSSPTGLAETATIAESAVTAVTIIEDTGTENHTADAHDAFVLLIETEIVGRGYPVSVKFTDHVPWSQTGAAPLYISYRLQIVDPNSVVQTSHEQKVIEISAFGWDTWTHPDITVVSDLRDGLTYRAQVHFYQQTGIGVFSEQRRFVITDLKR
jgi:hypothetical protein